MTDGVLIEELYERVPAVVRPLFACFRYPWEVLPAIEGYLWRLVREGCEGFTLFGDGRHALVKLLNQNAVSHGALLYGGSHRQAPQDIGGNRPPTRTPP